MNSNYYYIIRIRERKRENNIALFLSSLCVCVPFTFIRYISLSMDNNLFAFLQFDYTRSKRMREMRGGIIMVVVVLQCLLYIII